MIKNPLKYKTILAFGIFLPAVCGSQSSLANKLQDNMLQKYIQPENEIKNKIQLSGTLIAEYSHSKTPTQCSVTDVSKKIGLLINKSRSKKRKCGRKKHKKAPEIRPDCALQRLAEQHAKDMFRSGKLSHKSSEGDTLSERADKLTIEWRALAENVSEGYRIAEQAHQAWLDSPSHCVNIMNPIYNEIGAAEYNGYWVVVFANK